MKWEDSRLYNFPNSVNRKSENGQKKIKDIIHFSFCVFELKNIGGSSLSFMNLSHRWAQTKAAV